MPNLENSCSHEETNFNKLLNASVENKESDAEENDVDSYEGNVASEHIDTGYISIMQKMHRYLYSLDLSDNCLIILFRSIYPSIYLSIYLSICFVINHCFFLF